jgi:hypothetical protein
MNVHSIALFLAVASLGCGTQVVTDGVAPSPTTEPESPEEPEPPATPSALRRAGRLPMSR